MLVNELRIGNWVEWEDESHEQFQVKKITSHGDIWFINGGLLDDMLPIPLTEDWIIKLGGKKETLDAGHGIGFYDSYSIPGFELSRAFINTWHIMGVDSIPIKHVHQLQNLYFALTGQELVIND